MIGSAVILAAAAGSASFPPIIGGEIEENPTAMPILTVIISELSWLSMALSLVVVKLRSKVSASPLGF